jgi:hypothetical protein
MRIVGIARFGATKCRCGSSPLTFGMRMSTIRQETRLSPPDFRKFAARASSAAEEPADSSRSLVVSRIVIVNDRDQRALGYLDCVFRLMVDRVSTSTWTRVPAQREQNSGVIVDSFRGEPQ